MIRFFRNSGRVRPGDYWLAGRFDRKGDPAVDRAMAAWSEILGREGAELWLAANREVTVRSAP